MAVQTLGAFTKTTVNGKTSAVSPLSAVNAATGDSVVSAPITEDINNKKILVGINVDTAYAAVSATLVMEASPDGTNWVQVGSTIDADTDPETTGVSLYVIDLTSIYAPLFRLAFNKVTGVNVGTSGKIKFIYSV